MNEQVNQLVMNADLAAMPGEGLDPAAEQLQRKQRLAAALRIFGKFGFDEGVAGHITVRDPIDTETFWVNPMGRSFKQMCVSDLIRVDHDGQIVEGHGLVRISFHLQWMAHSSYTIQILLQQQLALVDCTIQLVGCPVYESNGPHLIHHGFNQQTPSQLSGSLMTKQLEIQHHIPLGGGLAVFLSCLQPTQVGAVVNHGHLKHLPTVAQVPFPLSVMSNLFCNLQRQPLRGPRAQICLIH